MKLMMNGLTPTTSPREVSNYFLSSRIDHLKSRSCHFSKIKESHPRLMDHLMDCGTTNKFPQSTQLHGKPTFMINKQGWESGEYMNKSLNKLTLEELFQLANSYSGDRSEKSSVMNRIA